MAGIRYILVSPSSMTDEIGRIFIDLGGLLGPLMYPVK